MTYTDDELLFLAYVPQMIGIAVASASSSGILGTGKELFASTSSLLEGARTYPHNSLIRKLVPDSASDRAQAVEWMKKSRDWATARMREKGVSSVENLRTLLVEDCRAASALLALKASPTEATEYKKWALSVAEKVASASSEGGFLGIGGERITAAEEALIDQVKSALGTASGVAGGSGMDQGGVDLGRNAGSAKAAAAVEEKPALAARPLAGHKVMITAGPTHEPIDAAHYIAKHSSGKLGYALAEAAVALGAETVLVSGPVNRSLPPGAQVMMANRALDMLKTCERELPCDIAIFSAAVSKWCLDQSSGGQPAKAQTDGKTDLKLVENPDIARVIGERTDKRPTIVVGFTVETENVIENGRNKLAAGSCDLMLASDLSASEILARDRNTIHVISEDGVETWSRLSKDEIARKLMHALAARLAAR
jgi:hypothetical protein